MNFEVVTCGWGSGQIDVFTVCQLSVNWNWMAEQRKKDGERSSSQRKKEVVLLNSDVFKDFLEQVIRVSYQPPISV